MAMLFDQPLDDFYIDDLYGYSNTIIDQNFWDAEEEKFNLGPLLPTPPISPGQQLELKQEAEAMESWATDAEVECYLSYSQNNNIVLNDKIWCDDKVFTPTELLADSSLKHKTPTLDDLVFNNTAHIRPITPPIKAEFTNTTPLKVVESPLKKPSVRRLPEFRLEQFPVVKIKEEPLSPTLHPSHTFFAPPPLKMSTECSFSDTYSSVTTVEIKVEPAHYVPPKPDIRVRVSVKEESSFEFTENKQSELVLKERVPRSKVQSTRRRNSASTSHKVHHDVKIEAKPSMTERRTSLRSSDSLSGEEDDEMNEVYLKRKLAEISSDSAFSSDDNILSPKRRISQSRYHQHSALLAEQAASKLTLEQLKNLSANHSHAEDEICSESCTKRFAHNVLERKRRNDLKHSYQCLQAEVPDICETDRVSKVVILKNSTEYIKKIEQEEQESREELKRLRNHQKHLINKFRQLFRLTQQIPSNK